MWHSLARSDIDRAKQQLELRRAEILRRQAEEIGRLEADQGELDMLNRLAEAFAEKYERAVPPPREPVVSRVAGGIAVQRHVPAPRRPDNRNYGRTNFETFARAVSRTGF